jgi:hypothetical protein
MLRTAARVFGFAFVLVGVLGFVPGITRNQMLLGVFHVNALHNIVHLLSGAAALAAAASSVNASRTFFRVFGVVYGLVAVLGFVAGDRPVLGLMANNVADTWLHVAIAAASLILGFVVKEAPHPETSHPVGPARPAT